LGATFPDPGQTLCLGLLPPAQLDVALLNCGPSLLTQTLLLPFTLLFCFALGHDCGISFFKNSRTGILRYPFTQKKHRDENKDDEGRDNLACEYIRRHRTK
jgi:hypothetical protein